MQSWRFQVFGEKLRLFGPDNRLVGERPLGLGDLIDEVEQGYAAPERTRDHDALGKRLYAWLDGASERWLSDLEPGQSGVALLLDFADDRLRWLPGELLWHDGGFLCTRAGMPFTPVRSRGRGIGAASRLRRAARRAR